MNWLSQINERLDRLKNAGLYRHLAVSEGISFSHNDYLGLSTHPKIIEAGKEALDVFGAGSRGSRLLGGHSRIFEEAEERIQEFFKSPAALFFSTGYLANLTAIQVMSSLVDSIASDEKNHASLIDGIRLTRLPVEILPHGTWKEGTEKRLYVSESLFSMDGDVVIPKDTRKDLLLIDEAHAVGAFQEEGRGFVVPTADWSKTAVTVTFGKAFGLAGAAILCSKELKELFLNEGRGFIYTTAPTPALPAMVCVAIDVIQEEHWRREELWQRAINVREVLSEIRGNPEKSLWDRRSPIIPVHMPGEDSALRFCQNMRESGLDLRAIRYPTVARGSERIRLSLSLQVSRENTEAMAKEMVRQWKVFS